jgi:cation transport regulator
MSEKFKGEKNLEMTELYYNSLKDLPERVRNNLPEHAQYIFMDAFNNAWEQYKEPEKRRGGQKQSHEEVAFKVAWSAVEKEYKRMNRENG